MNHPIRTVACALTLAAATVAHAKTIDLPAPDREAIEATLGENVVGDAVNAPVIVKPVAFLPLREASLFYRESDGRSAEAAWSELDRNPPGSGWRVAWDGGAMDVYRADDGAIQVLSLEDRADGLRLQLSPPSPLLLPDMKPGSTRTTTSAVNAFSLEDPSRLAHTGSLDVELTYVGAYRVTTPAGEYDAILLRSAYKGNIGATKIDDVAYRLLTMSVGVVGEVDRRPMTASAGDERTGRLLLAAPKGAPAPAPAAKPRTTASTAPINARDREARNVIAKFKAKDPGLQRFFDDAAGYAVFPSVAKGAFIVGGARGDGVVYQNDQVIGYSTLTQGTVGLQVGGQAYSEIIFFEHDGALAHFKSGNAEFSGQVSAVAVTAGASADADYAEGVAVFTMTKGGAMLEASIGGQGFSYEPRE